MGRQKEMDTNHKGSRKKVLVLMASPLRRGGGVKEKKLFF